MRVSVRGAPIAVSPLEYRLIAYLLRNRGRVVSQHELDENVYGQGEDHDSNALEVLVGRVRKKLGPSVPTLTLEKSTGIICRRRNTSLIETRRGFGYTVPERV
jgi:DNA-binding response OmpR family regulator